MKSKRLERKGDLTKLDELIPTVQENLKLDEQKKIAALNEIWPLVTSFDIAKNSKIGYYDKTGNLVVLVKNATLSTELSLQKTTLETKFRKSIDGSGIEFKSLRFTVRNF